MGKREREKGAGYERELAQEFQSHGFDARRGGMTQAQDSTNDPDVVVEGIPEMWVEAKRGQKGDKPLAALRQAMVACGPDRFPVAIGRPDRQPSIASMYLEDFLKLLRKAYPDAVRHLDIEFENPQSTADGPRVVVDDKRDH